MEQQDIGLEIDRVVLEKYQGLGVEDYQPENIARCALRFQSKNMDDNSRKKLDELYQLLEQARQTQQRVVHD
ncbi:hypothetical protein [Rodentibacter genomosp. 2]|uniref:hypothetical protein n=1 Tax=Rodentibacter genomosp. 2 TaxID=1908266 RepID=UPI001FC9424B